MHNDNEIIKALECSPLNDIGGCRKIDALDLINRQKAEIERLQEENKNHKAVIEAIEDTINPLPFETDFDKAIKTAKSEAIKEFAERLQQEIQESKYRFNDSPYARACNQVADWCIEVSDNLVKEMVGDDNV